MTNLILTKQMIRDHIIFSGAISLDDLLYRLNLAPQRDKNTLMNLILSLVQDNQVDYDSQTGKYFSKVVIE